MANLRAGIIPYMSTGPKREVTRLASDHIHVHANTWTRYVTVTLGKDGRLSVHVVDDGLRVIDVELPANEGPHKDAFTPIIKTSPEIEREILEALLKKYFGDDMAKSLLITLGLKGSPISLFGGQDARR